MKKKSFVLLLIVALLAVTMFAGCSDKEGGANDEWPSQTVKIIVPFAAGGSTDMTFRTLADQLTEDLGVNFVVENKEGGSGSLGLAEAGNAKPDGYTFGIGMGSNMCMVPNMSDTGYDAFDFTPVCQVTNTPLALAVNKDLPITTLEEFIEYAKNNELTYSSSGANNTQQVTMTLLGNKEGFEATHIPQDGAPAAVAACMGGHVDAVMAVATDLVSAYESDEVRVICLFDKERIGFLPEVPCSAELGYEDLTYGVWYSLVGPKGLDPAIVDKMEAAVVAALDSDYVKDAYKKMSVNAVYMNAEDLAAKIADYDKVMDEVMADW